MAPYGNTNARRGRYNRKIFTVRFPIHPVDIGELIRREAKRRDVTQAQLLEDAVLSYVGKPKT